MAHKVFFHIGLPKTGTTYLQTIMWRNRDELARQGVLLPGESSRQHLWASGVVREDPKIDRRGPDAHRAWHVLAEEANAWAGTAVISHEFFAAASEQQAAKAMADLRGAEVHVVVTARDTLGLVTARWQEFVKNGSTVDIDDYPTHEHTDPRDEWDWGTMDLGDVLRRWGATLPPEQVHVVTLPKPGLPPETLWVRFAELLGIDPTCCDSAESRRNESLGVVEVELLRRVNGDLTGFNSALDRGVWIRGYLAQGTLVLRKGEKFWPSSRRIEQLRARGAESVAVVKTHGYDVIGDVEDLLTPDDVATRRHPSSVTDAEMLAAATGTIAEMLTDVRRVRNELRVTKGRLRGATRELEMPFLSRVARRLKRRAERLGRPVLQMWSRS